MIQGSSVVPQFDASFKTVRLTRVTCDTPLLCHNVAQKLMLDENFGLVKLGGDTFVSPWTTSAAFLSQCTVLLLLTKNLNDSVWRARWKHFSVLVLVEFHLSLSLSTEIGGFCLKRKWSFVEEHQARCCQNWSKLQFQPAVLNFKAFKER